MLILEHSPGDHFLDVEGDKIYLKAGLSASELWGNYSSRLSWTGGGDEKTEKSPFLTFLEPLLVSLDQNDSYFLSLPQNGEQ